MVSAARATTSVTRSVLLPGTFPVTTSDLLMFRGYDGVYGIATRDRVVNGRVVRAGDIMWRSKTTAGLHQLFSSDGTDDIVPEDHAQHERHDRDQISDDRGPRRPHPADEPTHQHERDTGPEHADGGHREER